MVFPLLAIIALRIGAAAGRTMRLALLNLSLVWVLCITSSVAAYARTPARLAQGSALVGIYVLYVMVSWLLLRKAGRTSAAPFWMAFAFPLLLLPLRGINEITGRHLTEIFVGASYVAFPPEPSGN